MSALRDLAHRYDKLGWSLHYAPPNSKGPRQQGWPDRPVIGDLIDKTFAGPGNLAVRAGKASNGLVDIDLDCTEALALAPIYLPPTRAIFGRPGKRGSHLLYYAPGAVFATFADPMRRTEKTLLELFADGREGGAHAITLPPSIIDSEQREWEGDTIEPAHFGAGKLYRRCAFLAIGCLVRRYVSEQASERPGPDLPHLLYEAETPLGREAYRWLGMPDPDRPAWRPKHRRDYTREELDLSDLVAAIPNDCDWHGWNRVGMAIWVASGGSDQGGIIFDAWSAKAANYNPYTNIERWRHYRRSPSSRLTVGSLIYLAQLAGWRPPHTARTA
ncbi:MAG: PriCT-2 domain-containing protein [Stellaceae bacterium]